MDQVGYAAARPKLAIVVTSDNAQRFTVHRVEDGAKVFEADLSRPRLDVDTGDAVRIANFTALSQFGRYEVRVDGVPPSPPFEIARHPYGRLLDATLRSFYGQRCGIDVDLAPDYPGYGYPACHRDEAWHRSSGREGTRKATGGWHDAGDYGRYVVNSGITTGTLLWAWELFPEVFAQRSLRIPESANETPDLLDEVRWNLEWMLSMQDADGGVWQKVTPENFPGFVMPHKDASRSYVIGTGAAPFKSSCATADFAAVMAIAGRAYRPFDGAFAQRTTAAAQSAWRWTVANPSVVFRNPEGVSTGEYGDGDCSDERIWAAAELWRTTGDEGAHAWFRANAKKAVDSITQSGPPEGWNKVGALGAWTYALAPDGDREVVKLIRSRSLRMADFIVSRSSRAGYRTPMTAADYVWGSNGVAANYAMQLMVANELRPDRRFVDAAYEVIHYLLGRNAFSTSWVSGFGSRPVQNLHHRPSGSDANSAPWPGLLSGGPNANRQDPLTKALGDSVPPAKVWVDKQDSYASNENAINWNAPLVFVLAGIEAADGEHAGSPKP